MTAGSGLSSSAPPAGQPFWRSIFRAPSTRLGWWSAALMITFHILMAINTAVFMRLPEVVAWWGALLPFYGILMLLCGLAAGITGLIAIIRRRERSWLVWLAVLPGLFVIFLLLGEFLVPH